MWKPALIIAGIICHSFLAVSADYEDGGYGQRGNYGREKNYGNKGEPNHYKERKGGNYGGYGSSGYDINAGNPNQLYAGYGQPQQLYAHNPANVYGMARSDYGQGYKNDASSGQWTPTQSQQPTYAYDSSPSDDERKDDSGNADQQYPAGFPMAFAQHDLYQPGNAMMGYATSQSNFIPYRPSYDAQIPYNAQHGVYGNGYNVRQPYVGGGYQYDVQSAVADPSVMDSQQSDSPKGPAHPSSGRPPMMPGQVGPGGPWDVEALMNMKATQADIEDAVQYAFDATDVTFPAIVPSPRHNNGEATVINTGSAVEGFMNAKGLSKSNTGAFGAMSAGKGMLVGGGVGVEGMSVNNAKAGSAGKFGSGLANAMLVNQASVGRGKIEGNSNTFSKTGFGGSSSLSGGTLGAKGSNIALTQVSNSGAQGDEMMDFGPMGMFDYAPHMEGPPRPRYKRTDDQMDPSMMNSDSGLEQEQQDQQQQQLMMRGPGQQDQQQQQLRMRRPGQQEQQQLSMRGPGQRQEVLDGQQQAGNAMNSLPGAAGLGQTVVDVRDEKQIRDGEPPILVRLPIGEERGIFMLRAGVSNGLEPFDPLSMVQTSRGNRRRMMMIM